MGRAICARPIREIARTTIRTAIYRVGWFLYFRWDFVGRVAYDAGTLAPYSRPFVRNHGYRLRKHEAACNSPDSLM
jgi:hypothetical protein